MALESVGYYALPVIPSFKGVERGISSKIKTSFGKTGTQAGKLMGDNVAKGLAATKAKTERAAKAHSKALDRMDNAAGQARVEIQRLNEAINKGAKGSQLTAQTERVAKALRTEASAARDARTAQQQLQRARQSASSAGADGMDDVGESIESSGPTITPIAGKVGGAAGAAFMSAMGAVVSVAAVGALFKNALDTGIDFEKSVNMFGGVTASGAEGMQKMRDQAKALGADTKLAGVSARDAGDAMVELAKGGLTAQEAMEAARGTLQLATAGQLDAAQAAQIQSAALNTWQLDASNAARVADLLAAGANASAADVSDLGMALQQGGAVAAGFGVSIEDSITALTVFSKWGINGSDAGTMLKTSLQAITDQGKPAQEAIHALGLNLYDAHGQFVGVESMMKQVGEASKRMTEEQFQAAAAVLFGSDAMRASMVAANGGADAWDATAEAVTRQGAAADMAGAQMQGLPGIVESLSNVWEGFKLKLFDVIDGPLIAIGNWFVDFLSGDAAGGAGEILGSLGDTFKSIGAVVGQYLMPALRDLWDNLKGPLAEYGKQLVETFKAAMPALKAVGVVIGGALIGAIRALSVTLPVVVNVMTSAIATAKGFYVGLSALGGMVGSVAGAMMSFWTDTIVPAWKGIEGAFSAGWTAVSGVFEKLKTGFQGVRDFVSNVWRGLAAVVKGALDAVINAVKGPLRWIGGVLSRVPTSIGPVQIPGAQAAKDLGATLQGLRAGTDKRGVLYGPGTGTSDSILGVDRATGAPTAFVSTGEGVVRADSMRKGGGPIVAALNAGWIPSADYLRSMLPHAAGGLNPGASWIKQQIQKMWPEVSDIGGYRPPDGYNEHSSGNALDIMIPNWDTPQGKALGDQIAAWIQENRDAFGLTHMIWQQRLFKPGDTTGSMMNDRGSATQNHYDHVHAWFQKGGGALPNASAVKMPTGMQAGAAGTGLDRGYTTGGGADTSDKSSMGAADRDIADAEQRIAEADAKVREEEAALRELAPDATESQRIAAQNQLDAAKADADKARREKADAEAAAAEAKRGTPVEGAAGGGAGGPQLSEIGSIASQFLEDTFGLGDLIPHPKDLGITKLFSSLMGMKFTDGTKSVPWWQAGSLLSGNQGGGEMPWAGDPLAGTGSGSGGGLNALNALGGLIPDVTIPPPPAGDQHMPADAPAGMPVAPGPTGSVDQSTNITINSPQGDPKDIEQRTRRTLLNTPRLNTYSGPGPAGR